MHFLKSTIVLFASVFLCSCIGPLTEHPYLFGNEALGTCERGDSKVTCTFLPDGQVIQSFTDYSLGAKRVEVGDWDLYYGGLNSNFIGNQKYDGERPWGTFGSRNMLFNNDPDDPTSDPKAFYVRSVDEGVTLEEGERARRRARHPYPIINYHYIDKHGQTVIPGEFVLASDFDKGCARVVWSIPPAVRRMACCEQIQCVVDTNGHYHPTMFSERLRSKPGLYAADARRGINDRWWNARLSLDRFDKPTARINYGRFGNPTAEGDAFANSPHQYLAASDVRFGFLDSKGHVSIEPRYEFAESFSEGLAVVQDSGKYYYINQAGKKAIDPQAEFCTSFSGGLAAIVVKEKWGYIDPKGKFLIAPQFEYGGPFQDGLAPAKQNGKFGFIDRSGKFIIKPHYFGALRFSEDLAPVLYENGKWGYVDRNDRVVIKPAFDKAAPFSNGRACVGDLLHPETDFAKDKESRASQYLLLARTDVGNPNVLQLAKRAIEISGTGKVAEETRTWMEVRGLVDATPEAIAAFSKASVHAEKRNQPEVERQMRECIKTHPSFIHSYYGLATALNQLGRTAEAEEILRTAQKMNPRYTRTYLGFSQCEYKKKNFAKALEYAKKALELDPLDYYNQRQVIELTTEGAAAKLPQ